jgi:hypothetical protein
MSTDHIRQGLGRKHRTVAPHDLDSFIYLGRSVRRDPKNYAVEQFFRTFFKKITEQYALSSSERAQTMAWA